MRTAGGSVRGLGSAAVRRSSDDLRGSHAPVKLRTPADCASEILRLKDVPENCCRMELQFQTGSDHSIDTELSFLSGSGAVLR